MNRFLHTLDAVHFKHYKPSDAQAAIDDALQLAHTRIKHLYTLDASASFAEVVLGFTRCSEELDFVVGIIFHLESVCGKRWQAAKEYALEKGVKFGLQLQFDKKIYDLMVNFRSSHPALARYEARLLDKLIEGFEDNGVNLQRVQQRKLEKLLTRSSKLSQIYKSNIRDARQSSPLHVTDRKELTGIDNGSLAVYANQAKAIGQSGYIVTNDEASYESIMSRCSHEPTRQKMHRLFTTAAATKNNHIMHQVLTIRIQIADLLGYASPAHMLMRQRMVTRPKRALDFINKHIGAYVPLALTEYEQLNDFAQSLGKKDRLQQFDFDSSLDLYYPSLHFHALYGVDLSEAREYFEFENVKNEMLRVLSTLYTVEFRKSRLESWHKDVEVYDIFSGSDWLAQVHCDWFVRHNKNGHAWMNQFIVAERANGVDKPHIGCVVTNFDPPKASTPSLLSISSVTTMWHEFGHFMHLAFSATKLKEQSMMSTKWDFVEAPSQIMENWPIRDELLARYAVHYKTRRLMPKKMRRALQEHARYNVGLKTVRQLFLALLDLELHDGRKFDTTKEMVNFAMQRRQALLPSPTMAYYTVLNSFGHLLGGYAAGYYSYKWAETIQVDLFSRFDREGVLNPGVGTEYRNTILARGDEDDPDLLIRDFLGRPWNKYAIFRRDNVMQHAKLPKRDP
jgi:Zn-dependent oligopeptidase